MLKLKHTTMIKRNYTKFYALLRQCPSADKDELVLQYTDGRTTHLTQMTEPEYQEMVAALEEAAAPSREDLRRWRSSVLLRIGRLGISTIDNWEEVNAFVSSPKIAGKVFYALSVPELKTLVRKLEAIEKKGGIKKPDPVPQFVLTYQPSNILS